MSVTTTPIHPASDPTLKVDMPARVEAATLRDWLTRPDRTRIIDVRSAAEFRAAHIPTAYNVPLPLLREHRAEFVEPLDEQIVLVCRTDRRAAQAEEHLAAAGLSRLHVLSGGMQAWEQAGAPINRGDSRQWDIERQVRLVAGSLVASGVLASTVRPGAKWLAGAVGAGLVTAALTDSCVMGSALSRLPFNRAHEPDLTSVVEALRADR